jgi:glycosyltransferase involved in cell wall biosynthesis
VESVTRPIWGAVQFPAEYGLMTRIRRVAIIQPAIPQYRVPFFTRLIAAAEKEGIHIDVFGGETPTETRARGDSGDAEFIRALSTRELAIRGRALFYKSTAPILRGGYDLVIVEHAVRNIETYELLVRLRGRRVAFWGHGRTYTKPVSPQQESFKYWLARRARWFFGYTNRSVDAVVENGFPRARTTVLNNTFDTAALLTDLSRISDTDVLEFSRHHDLRGITALYLGGIDTYKRIPFLLESAVTAHELCSDFRLLIAGNGADRPIVEEFVTRNSWASYLGAVHGRAKALALKAAQAVSIPGAIGLVALDSMVAGTPIVTTDFQYHGPEFDYLTDGVTAVVTPDDIRSYATGLVAFLRSKSRQQKMSALCRIEAQTYTLDGMVCSFLAGIMSALQIDVVESGERSRGCAE